MFFGWTEFFGVIKIALVLTLAFFAGFLPLAAIFKNYRLALKLTIPISLSIQVIFAYIFYSFRIAKVYPLFYLAILVLANLVAVLILRPWQIRAKKIGSPRLLHIFLAILPIVALLAVIIWTRFYDAALNLPPGAIDAYSHLYYLNNLKTSGLLSQASYAPGWHLFIYPLIYFVDSEAIYRFTGPVLGLFAILATYLLLGDFLKERRSKYLLALLFILPVFSFLSLQTISFFPTTLTFILLPFYLFLAARPKELSEKIALWLYSLAIAALSLSVPYFLNQYAFGVLLLLVAAVIFRKRLERAYWAYALKFFLITLVAFGLAFGHVFLQTKLQRGGAFPDIPVAVEESGNLVESDNSIEVRKTLENAEANNKFLNLPAVQKFVGTSFARNYFLPMLWSGTEIIKLKNIRPPSGLLAIGAYLWLAISLAALGLAIVRKDKFLLALMTFSLAFGAATQAGIGEIGSYRGRSGWYLLLVCLVGIVYLFDLYLARRSQNIFLVVAAGILLIGIKSPLTFYRPYFPDPYIIADQISNAYPDQTITLFSNEDRLRMVGDNLQSILLNTQYPEINCSTDKCFLILEKKFPSWNLNRLQIAYNNSQGKKYLEGILDQKNKDAQAQIDRVKALPEFKSWPKWWENDRYEVYEIK